MFIIQILLASLALLTLFLVFKSINLRKIIKRPSRFFFIIINSALSLLFSILFLTVILYSSSDFKEPVAKVAVKQISEQKYILSLKMQAHPSINYEVHGDMWQIDLRMLVWSNFWNALGLRSLYQFDRLSGRYEKISDEQFKQRSVHDLSQFEFGNELHSFWKLLSSLNLLPGLEVKFGSAAFVPLVNDGEYQVFVLRSGVQIRPANKTAQIEIESW